ncbi:MAG: DUF2358 domain-containing protein [Leptolyngbyaceae cyanobacterium SM1_1_3]|nr:DUF2358 domain-containing protein [Leptolyngbyaceae cyanobacterium SM1_1_3]NJN03758.1 DUF2358 domain-containing protein [Leptolyngbyaceae cyanobacterium RM1_1_2]NJO08523.1 DUF2358 domain-containing protein [Leptolyngbyaceae cyanobacterium SL_1_1]
MDIVEQLRQDYTQFPQNQSFDLYTEQVYFKDPLNEFRGKARYRQMIGFIQHWFIDTHMDLQGIERSGQTITTRWILHFTAPVPWKPRISIPGCSKLTLSDDNLISAHIDYWDCSRLAVVQQLFG